MKNRNMIDDKKDKAPPKHNYFTEELVRRSFLNRNDDFSLYMYDELFEDILTRYDFKTIIIAISYTIRCIRSNNFEDEQGKNIKCLYAYFKVSLLNNIHKLTTNISIDWLDDN